MRCVVGILQELGGDSLHGARKFCTRLEQSFYLRLSTMGRGRKKSTLKMKLRRNQAKKKAKIKRLKAGGKKAK